MNEQSEKPVEEVKAPEVDVKEVEEVKAQAIVGPTLTALVDMLHQAVEDARAIVSQYQVKINHLAMIERNLVSRETSVKDSESIFAAREAACQKVENAVALEASSKALLEDAQSRLAAAQEAERKLSDATAIARAEIADSRAIAQREANAVLEQRKDIDKEVAKRVSEMLAKMGIKTEEGQKES